MEAELSKVIAFEPSSTSSVLVLITFPSVKRPPEVVMDAVPSVEATVVSVTLTTLAKVLRPSVSSVPISSVSPFTYTFLSTPRPP